MRTLLTFLLAVGLMADFGAKFARAQQDDDASQLAPAHDYDADLASLTASIQASPTDPKLYFRRSYIYMSTNHDDKAAADLDQAIALKPNFKQAYFRLGFVDMMDSKFDQAVASLQHAVQIDPKFWQAYFRLAYVHLMMGKYDGALADINQEIQLNPGFAGGYIRRSLAYQLKGDFTAAEKELTDGIQRWPQAAGFDNRLAWIMATCPQAQFRDGAKAVANATKACDLTNWESNAELDTLAAACAEAGDFADAVKWENETLQNPSPEDHTLVERQARLALYRAGKPYHPDHYDPHFEMVVY
jgi:tetratricopeptide (TPR) repeat protein